MGGLTPLQTMSKTNKIFEIYMKNCNCSLLYPNFSKISSPESEFDLRIEKRFRKAILWKIATMQKLYITIMILF